jgi:hypothetical protein
VKEFNYELTLPEGKMPPGARLYLRGEMTMDGTPVQYSAPTVVRVAAPLPSIKTATASDVLLFCHEGMAVEDYTVMEAVCAVLHLTLHYVDIDHYIDNTGKVPQTLWESISGSSALIIWCPGDEKSSYIPAEQVHTHILIYIHILIYSYTYILIYLYTHIHTYILIYSYIFIYPLSYSFISYYPTYRKGAVC